MAFFCFLIICYYHVPGRICVPIDPDHCDDFDPITVPTLSQVYLCMVN